MTLAITGATGFVGQAVLEEAERRGFSIRALTRREQSPRDGVAWVRGDLHDHDALALLLDGADAVLHIAGVVNAPDLVGFMQGNVEGTRNLLRAASGASVARFICVSSLAAREPGLSDYGSSKRLAEELVQTSRTDWTIVRPPAIYGPRDTEMLELFRCAGKGILPMPPAGRASLIHVYDLARLLLDLGPADALTSRRIFEPDDGRECGWAHRDLAGAIGVAMGRNVWSPALPAGVIKVAARLDRLLRGDNAKLTPDRARYMIHPDWVSDPTRKTAPEMWSPHIKTERGLRETADWYRKNGWI